MGATLADRNLLVQAGVITDHQGASLVLEESRGSKIPTSPQPAAASLPHQQVDTVNGSSDLGAMLVQAGLADELVERRPLQVITDLPVDPLLRNSATASKSDRIIIVPTDVGLGGGVTFPLMRFSNVDQKVRRNRGGRDHRRNEIIDNLELQILQIRQVITTDGVGKIAITSAVDLQLGNIQGEITKLNKLMGVDPTQEAAGYPDGSWAPKWISILARYNKFANILYADDSAAALGDYDQECLRKHRQSAMSRTLSVSSLSSLEGISPSSTSATSSKVIVHQESLLSGIDFPRVEIVPEILNNNNNKNIKARCRAIYNAVNQVVSLIDIFWLNRNEHNLHQLFELNAAMQNQLAHLGELSSGEDVVVDKVMEVGGDQWLVSWGALKHKLAIRADALQNFANSAALAYKENILNISHLVEEDLQSGAIKVPVALDVLKQLKTIVADTMPDDHEGEQVQVFKELLHLGSSHWLIQNIQRYIGQDEVNHLHAIIAYCQRCHRDLPDLVQNAKASVEAWEQGEHAKDVLTHEDQFNFLNGHAFAALEAIADPDNRPLLEALEGVEGGAIIGAGGEETLLQIADEYCASSNRTMQVRESLIAREAQLRSPDFPDAEHSLALFALREDDRTVERVIPGVVPNRSRTQIIPPVRLRRRDEALETYKSYLDAYYEVLDNAKSQISQYLPGNDFQGTMFLEVKNTFEAELGARLVVIGEKVRDTEREIRAERAREAERVEEKKKITEVVLRFAQAHIQLNRADDGRLSDGTVSPVFGIGGAFPNPPAAPAVQSESKGAEVNDEAQPGSQVQADALATASVANGFEYVETLSVDQYRQVVRFGIKHGAENSHSPHSSGISGAWCTMYRRKEPLWQVFKSLFNGLLLGGVQLKGVDTLDLPGVVNAKLVAIFNFLQYLFVNKDRRVNVNCPQFDKVLNDMVNAFANLRDGNLKLKQNLIDLVDKRGKVCTDGPSRTHRNLASWFDDCANDISATVDHGSIIGERSGMHGIGVSFGAGWGRG